MKQFWDDVKFVLAGIGIGAVTVFFLMTRQKQYKQQGNENQVKLQTPEAVKQYEAEAQAKAVEMAKADAREVMKQWTERFGGRASRP